MIEKIEKYIKWRKLKNADIINAEKLLRQIEKKYVSACARFLLRDKVKTNIWVRKKNKNEIASLLINSRSTLMPLLCEDSVIEELRILLKKNIFKNIHSIQGPVQDTKPFEKLAEYAGIKTTDIFDYHLMESDKVPDANLLSSGPSALVLRVPSISDLDALSPLQAAYEKEEVIPKGGTFHPAASRLNLANIIADSRILAAELDGRLVGKINVNAVSFTRYQIGGVYVHPDFRGRGIARRMAAEFNNSLIKEGRGVTLFVKKNNIPALKLYKGLGFTETDDYRIAYY